MKIPLNMLLNLISLRTKIRWKIGGKVSQRITISFLKVSFDFQLILILGLKAEDLFQSRDCIQIGRDEMVQRRVWERGGLEASRDMRYNKRLVLKRVVCCMSVTAEVAGLEAKR
jgi:hypothetical protein